MKRSNLDFTVLFLNRFRKTKGGLLLPETITKEWLMEGIQKEQVIQDFLCSLRPGDIILYRDFDGDDYGVFEETVVSVNDWNREILVKELGTSGQPERTLSAYWYGKSIIPERELSNEIKKKWKM